MQNLIIVQKRCIISCIKDKLVQFFPQKADATDFPTTKIWVKLDDYSVACVQKKFEKSVGKPAHGRERVLIKNLLFNIIFNFFFQSW